MSTMQTYLTLRRLWQASLLLAGCQWLVACGSLRASDTVPTFRNTGISLQDARDAIVVGQTTQAETMATLGPATEIRFDSGYAVWVYRDRAAEPGADRAEFVVLFAPSGIVKKTRLRPAYKTTGE